MQIELNINEMSLHCVAKVVDVRMRLELIVDIVSIIVGIVIDNVAEFHSRICC